ncbi:MAG: hypothetical protein RRC34_03560 [Lentisphaeria bacterium]|nr:hypothetical protein [Lentisphaeria bacterium]
MRLRPIFFMVFFLVMAARGDRDRWVETNRWSGTGMKTTEEFLVGGKSWRVIAHRKGETPKTVAVFKKGGEFVSTVNTMDKGLTSFQTLEGPGAFHLSVPESDGAWTIRVIQKMTVIEEWNFRQELKKPLPPLQKVSVFSGADGLERFTITVPAGKSWKLVCAGEKLEGGNLTLRVTRLGTTEQSEFRYEAGKTVDCVQWFLDGGEFELTVDAQNSSWRAEVLTE